MVGACVDRRRLVSLVLVALAAMALALPVGAMASSLGTGAKAAVKPGRRPALTAHHAGGHLRAARQYHEFGRKVG